VAMAVAMMGPTPGSRGGKFFCHAEVPEQRCASVLLNVTFFGSDSALISMV
jgi:hypothetical protein